MFFVSVGIQAWRFRKKEGVERKSFCIATVVVEMLCVIQCFYNNALRVENSGYLMFFVLAIPFICRKTQAGGINETGKS